jgi:CrcB protein
LLSYLMVLLGGGLGSLARYATSSAVMRWFGGRFPLGTLAVNLTGSFAAGLLMALLTERFQPHPYWRILLVAGFLGGYTTFSSLEYESLALARGGGTWWAFANLLGSVIFGFAAVWLGALVAARR